MSDYKFAVFIPTHKRADTIKSYDTLRMAGYTGKIILVVDNEDTDADKYLKKFGDNVIVFDKQKWYNKSDTMHTRYKPTVLFARNFIIDFAKTNGYDYFVMMDDDISKLLHVYSVEDKLKKTEIDNLDIVFNLIIKLQEHSGIDILSFSQDGGYFGGAKGRYKNGLNYNMSMMMIFKSSTAKMFVGEFNEDTNYINTNYINSIILEISDVCGCSPPRGTKSGGLTDFYDEDPEYIRNYYSLMCRPDAIVLDENGKFRKYSNKLFPRIISEKYKKY